MSREDAYAIVQRTALRAADERRPLREVLAAGPGGRGGPGLGHADRELRRRAGAPSRGDHPGAAGRPGTVGCRPMAVDASARSFLRSGKVRDLYALDDDRLLLVASDRLSAFDVVLPTPVPDKGRVLTGLSRFWFGLTAAIVPDHLLDTRSRVAARRHGPAMTEELRGRIDDLPAGQPAARGAHRPWLPVGQRLARLPAHGCRVRRAAAGGPARERPAAGAGVHALHQGRDGARPEHRLRCAGGARGRARRGTCPGHRARRLPRRARLTRSAGASCSRTPRWSWVSPRTGSCCSSTRS